MYWAGGYLAGLWLHWKNIRISRANCKAFFVRWLQQLQGWNFLLLLCFFPQMYESWLEKSSTSICLILFVARPEWVFFRTKFSVITSGKSLFVIQKWPVMWLLSRSFLINLINYRDFLYHTCTPARNSASSSLHCLEGLFKTWRSLMYFSQIQDDWHLSTYRFLHPKWKYHGTIDGSHVDIASASLRYKPF